MTEDFWSQNLLLPLHLKSQFLHLWLYPENLSSKSALRCSVSALTLEGLPKLCVSPVILDLFN